MSVAAEDRRHLYQVEYSNKFRVRGCNFIKVWFFFSKFVTFLDLSAVHIDGSPLGLDPNEDKSMA